MTTFDATITLTPWSLAGTPLLGRPQDAAEAVRKAVEAMSGAAWIDVEWQNIRGEWPLVDRMVVRASDEEGHAEALKGVVEMVAKRAIEVLADRVRLEVMDRPPHPLHLQTAWRQIESRSRQVS